ncbi:MAG: tRNA (N(6)-L-threonylcarbamoyladenosine(37)-C(2))-methylthiotransferase MtaB [Bacteroidetes bacterium]|nr:tRNA (N(6)-L-threonylcarbamoyladenosine(37)-C(2))-methylthiotransferase MtaB [Bacteroidota bacterium]
MNPRTIAFHHFGCKVNFAEASALSRQFKERGFQIRNFHEPADVYVISTCVVTAVAEKKCRAAIRQAHKLNPEGKIAVIGCFPELSPGELEKMEGVSIVLGHSAKFTLPEEVERLFTPGEYGHPHLPSANDFVPSWSLGDRTRSFLKIQDGCDYYCSYCTIPLARGHSRSDTIENVIKNAKEVAQAGIKEIVLTGVNIGDFGRHNNESFPGLVKALDKVEEVSRIRVSSIEPDLLNDEIIDLIASSGKFMPHFHIPLQSGSDTILKSMKRKYNTAHFASRIKKIREVLPLACIATDVIVGFPGETDADFRETYNYLEGLDLSYMHVFSYSKRENTLASKMPEPVQDRIKKERSHLLHQLSETKKKDFYLKNKGALARVLFEGDNSGGFMHGFTENYIKVRTLFDAELVNQIVEVRLEELDEKLEYVVKW